MNAHTIFRFRAGAGFLLPGSLLLGGCTVGPSYQPPKVTVTSNFGELTGAAATQPSRTIAQPIVLAQWWKTFRDPELDKLIDKAAKQNWNVKEAEARLRQARAQRSVVATDEYPMVNADGGYNHAHGSKNVTAADSLSGGGASSGGGTTAGRVARAAQSRGGSSSGGSGDGASIQNSGQTGPENPLGLGGLPGATTDLTQVGFDASWEIDVFGGVRRSIEAADADVAAAIEDRRDVLISLLAEVARDYVQLRGYQRELQISEENLHAQQDTLNLTRERFAAGVSTQLDVARAAAEVATTAATVPGIVTNIRIATHALSVLVGEQPEALTGELSPSGAIPPVPPEIPVGFPSDLLKRRPDVRRAERQLAAANARIGVATADLFPKFSISAALGLDSSQPKHLFDYSSRYYDIIPGFSWAIFDAGRIRANIRVQDAAQQQAVDTYQQTVLTALRDVADALVQYDSEQLRHASLAEAVAANRQAVDLASDQYKQGVVDFLSVLDAQRNLYTAQDALVQSDSLVTANLVALYKALGGGWEVEHPAQPASVAAFSQTAGS